MLVAAFFMFWKVWQYPLILSGAEPLPGLSALKVLKRDRDIHAFLWEKPIRDRGVAGSTAVEQDPFVVYPIAFFFRILGVTHFALRLPSMLYGLGSVWLLWAIGRFFGRRVGVFGALMMAMSAWFLGTARAAQEYSVTIFFSLLCVYVYFRLRPSQCVGYLALGILGSLAPYLYGVSRPLIVLIAFSMGVRLLTERTRRKERGQALIILVAGFLVGVYFLQGGDFHTYFVSNIPKDWTIFYDGREGSIGARLGANLLSAYKIMRVDAPFSYDEVAEGPFSLDCVSWWLFLLGVLWSLVLAWRWKYLFIVLWFVIAAAPPLITGAELRRGFLATPVYYLIAAVGLDHSAELLARAVRRRRSSASSRLGMRRRRNLIRLASFGLIAWMGWLNYGLYFVAYARLDESHFLKVRQRERETVVSLLKQGMVFTNHFYNQEYGYMEQIEFEAVRLGSACYTSKNADELRRAFEASPVSPRILYLDETIERK